MNHIGGIKSQLGGYLNYKYNGKELQETGMYDYGARFYMPDLEDGELWIRGGKYRRHSLITMLLITQLDLLIQMDVVLMIL
jgi:hypothetical protein